MVMAGIGIMLVLWGIAAIVSAFQGVSIFSEVGDILSGNKSTTKAKG